VAGGEAQPSEEVMLPFWKCVEVVLEGLCGRSEWGSCECVRSVEAVKEEIASIVGRLGGNCVCWDVFGAHEGRDCWDGVRRQAEFESSGR
jgi:hypothetical protein